MFEILLKLGLSEKEAKVYVAALKLGSAPAAKIAQTAELNRPTTYVILEKLCQMGLATVFDKGKIQYFTAEDPEQLFRMAESEKQAIEAKVKELESKLPELKALFAKNDRPRVLLYDATQSADQYFSRRLKTGEKTYNFTDLDTLTQSGEDRDTTKLRISRGIHSYVIYTRDAGPVENATSTEELRTAKFVSRGEFPFHSVISIAPESGLVFLKDPQSNTAVVIENELLAKSHKAIFDLLWAKI